jgi:cell wall-associated NlpC family hydrolase
LAAGLSESPGSLTGHIPQTGRSPGQDGPSDRLARFPLFRLAADGWTAEVSPPGEWHGDARESTGPHLEARINASTARRLTVAGLTAALVVTTGGSNRPATPEPAAISDPAPQLAERHTERATRGVPRTARVRTWGPTVTPVLTAEARGVPAVRKQRPQPRRAAERARTVVRKALKTRKVRALRRAPARAVRVAVGARAGARRVLAYAYRQIGKPYASGAAGPRAFDCSGLTQRAYGLAGIDLPHRAAGQRGRTVSAESARPGDLVKWGGYHVGIYVGGGFVVHAPKPGDRVKKSRLWGRHYFVRLL